MLFASHKNNSLLLLLWLPEGFCGERVVPVQIAGGAFEGHADITSASV